MLGLNRSSGYTPGSAGGESEENLRLMHRIDELYTACPFTSEAFTGLLKQHRIRISMDGKGRALDNIFVERLWRSVKYEEVYPRQYQSLRAAHAGLAAYFRFYNTERPHQSLANQTPADVYDNSQPLQRAA